VVFDDHTFALCLTHDLDRPYKSFRALYYAIRERRGEHLRDLLVEHNPYWQFENIMALERDLGVRSAFYVLNEPSIWQADPASWLDLTAWIQEVGRYDVRHPQLLEALRTLSAGGWEIGLHGSYHSHTDRERLRREKAELEALLGRPIRGGRQHYLRLAVPETWRHHAEIGLTYDASLGSSDRVGFDYGYRPIRPFADDFVVFPLTAMEQALPDPGEHFDAAWSACERLLDEAAANEAVMTVLWHPRDFGAPDFPGYGRLYRRLVERAGAMGAWVGSPAECYDRLDVPRDCVTGRPADNASLTKA